MKWFTICMTILATLAVPSLASAASFCGFVRYWDSRTPKINGTGSRLNGSDGNRVAENVVGYLYDKDGFCVDFSAGCSETDDDFLTTFSTNGAGAFCSTVASNPSDEPDVYMVATFQNDAGLVREADNSQAWVASNVLANNLTGTTWVNWNLMCTEDILYSSYGVPIVYVNSTSGFCDSQTDVDTYFAFEEPRADILATIRKVDDNVGLDGYHGYNHLVTGYYPDKPGFDCTTGHAFGRDTFCMGTLGNARAASATAHELGHLIHARSLAAYGTGEGYNWFDPLTGSCSGSWTDVVTEKCAVREGFASFVGAATLWAASSPNPLWSNSYRILEGDDILGNGSVAKACIYETSSPHLRAGNVVRWFWDLYDSTTTGDDGNDNATWTPSFIISQWEEFAYGVGNRDAAESGNAGVNAWDYKYRESGSLSELTQNCLNGQTP